MGIAAAVLIGFAAGWLRYWVGFFVLIQGGVAGALLAWLIATLGRSPGGCTGPSRPAFPGTLGYSLLWVAAFMAAEPFGLGLAQPWFDPWGWMGRVLAGKTVEPVFGLSSLGGVVIRSFSLGCQGWFWVFLNLLDALLMYVLLMALPWGNPVLPSIRKSSGKTRKTANVSSVSSVGKETP
jgi:hypothetical protein